MKAVRIERLGVPEEVCTCADIDDVGDPGDDEVVIEIEAAPINPADLLMIRGKYPGLDDFPAGGGIEGAGRVVAAGKRVAHVALGDRVINFGRANWAQRVRVNGAQALKVPADSDALQMAMLKANPASALLMIRDSGGLREGDWLIQNAANSAVGRHVIRLAGARGVRCVNVVRRRDLVEPLAGIGADAVVLDGDDLGERVRAETGGAAIKAAFDAIGGRATMGLADCLADGGAVVNYGFLSGEPCQISPDHLILHRLTLTGFWLVDALGRMPPGERDALYGELAGLFADGTLNVPIEAVYPIEDISQALAHAGREGRGGKILVTPNGAVG